MFFLPPSGISSASRITQTAPGGFTIPNNPNHAWEMINETYLGPFGWFLSLTAAPKGKSPIYTYYKVTSILPFLI